MSEISGNGKVMVDICRRRWTLTLVARMREEKNINYLVESLLSISCKISYKIVCANKTANHSSLQAH